MNTALVLLIVLLLAGAVLAFYMDWLGLWLSKAEMTEQIAQAKERMQRRPLSR